MQNWLLVEGCKSVTVEMAACWKGMVAEMAAYRRMNAKFNGRNSCLSKGVAAEQAGCRSRCRGSMA